METVTATATDIATATAISVIASLISVALSNISDDELTPKQMEIRKIYNILNECYDELDGDNSFYKCYYTMKELEFALELISKWSWTRIGSTKYIEEALNDIVRGFNAKHDSYYNSVSHLNRDTKSDEEVDKYYNEMREIARKKVRMFLDTEFNHSSIIK